MTTRLQTTIEQIERGDVVDWRRLRLLLDLDIARQSEQFVEDHLARQKALDDAAEQLATEQLASV